MDRESSVSTFKVYYAKNLIQMQLLCLKGYRPTITELKKTHVFLCAINAVDKEDVYRKMQATSDDENDTTRLTLLVKHLKLTHTSMSVGDVLQDYVGQYWVVDGIGFDKLL